MPSLLWATASSGMTLPHAEGGDKDAISVHDMYDRNEARPADEWPAIPAQEANPISSGRERLLWGSAVA
jgi:hypothetical protein